MRKSRLVPVVAAAALLVASTSPVQAQTEPEVSGVGTTTGALSLLGLDAGELLSLDLLTDSGSADLDGDAGSAVAQIAALALSSGALGISQELPVLKAESTGAEDAKSEAVTPIDNPVLSGSLTPLDLRALVGEDGAVSTVSAGLGQLQVLSGILGLDGAAIDLGNDALRSDSAATRGVDVDALTVLDLEALLALLGIPLTDLPLDSLLGLLDGLGLLGQLQAVLGPLGVDIRNLSTTQITALLDTTIDGIVGEVGTVVDEVAGVVADLGTTAAPLCEVTDTITDIVRDVDGIGGVIGEVRGVIGLSEPTVSAAATCTAPIDATQVVKDLTAQLETLLDQVQDLLDEVLAIVGAPLELLSGVALLSLDGLDVQVVTKATDDVATSVAEVTGTLGNLKVGELPALGALDLTAPTDQLNGVLAQAEGLIGGILDGALGDLVPGLDLSDLIQIQTMQQSSSVDPTEAGGVLSQASFTGLDVQVLPILGELTALLGALTQVESVGDVLTGIGVPLPDLGAADVLALNTVVQQVTGSVSLLGALAAVEDGLGLKVATLSQSSTFTPFAAAGPTAPVAPDAPGAPGAPAGPTLPRTGSDDGLLLALAAAAVLAALGGRQLVRRTASDA